jgi:hypothetical protein
MEGLQRVKSAGTGSGAKGIKKNRKRLGSVAQRLIATFEVVRKRDVGNEVSRKTSKMSRYASRIACNHFIVLTTYTVPS